MKRCLLLFATFISQALAAGGMSGGGFVVFDRFDTRSLELHVPESNKIEQESGQKDFIYIGSFENEEGALFDILQDPDSLRLVVIKVEEKLP